MFKAGDTVVYGQSGLCRVTAVREETFGPVRQMYYVLNPLTDARSTFYCPVAQGEQKLRVPLTVEEIHSLIEQMPDTETVWQENDAARRDVFQAMLKSGDHRQLITLVKSVYQHREQRTAEGRRLHLADERVMQEAERILQEEFAYALAIPPNEVNDYIGHVLANIGKGL